MKMLMFLARHFTFRPFEKSLPEAGEGGGEVSVQDAAVIWVHAEPQDEADPAGLETKFVKNVKWIAGKRGFRNGSIPHARSPVEKCAAALSCSDFGHSAE